MPPAPEPLPDPARLPTLPALPVEPVLLRPVDDGPTRPSPPFDIVPLVPGDVVVPPDMLPLERAPLEVVPLDIVPFDIVPFDMVPFRIELSTCPVGVRADASGLPPVAPPTMPLFDVLRARLRVVRRVLVLGLEAPMAESGVIAAPLDGPTGVAEVWAITAPVAPKARAQASGMNFCLNMFAP